MAPDEVRVEGGITVVRLEKRVMGENDRHAARNRELLRSRGIVALNLISSPGAGKTTLLERTLHDLRGELGCAVIEGDVQTTNDARRIAAAGVPVVQINTLGACHLDAAGVGRALGELPLEGVRLLFIENVGNLICPTAWDLGEAAKVVLLATTEGEDKPEKYPAAFVRARALVLTKADLLPHLRFELERCRASALAVNPALAVLRTSAYTSEGMEDWLAWLRALVSSAPAR